MTRTSRSVNCITSGSDSGTKVTRLCSRIVTLDRGTATVKALRSDRRPTLMGGYARVSWMSVISAGAPSLSGGPQYPVPRLT